MDSDSAQASGHPYYGKGKFVVPRWCPICTPVTTKLVYQLSAIVVPYSTLLLSAAAFRGAVRWQPLGLPRHNQQHKGNIEVMSPTPREIPLVFSDEFRGLFTLILIPLSALTVSFFSFNDRIDAARLVMALCAVTVLASLSYIAWTHVLFSRTPPERLLRIAAAQQRRPLSLLARALGMNQQDAGSTALSAAALAIAVAIASILIGSSTRSAWLPFLVLATAATSWATMVYAYALKYFRLHASGERISFDIDEEPEFQDFLSMSIMVSSVGAMSAGTPKTRKGLSAIRSHTWISFIFNAIVVAMTVSILSSLISGLS